MAVRPKLRIGVIPGDGIGQEVIREAVKVLHTLNDLKILDLELVQFKYDAEEYLKTGIAIPDDLISEFRKKYDAILLGTFGDPRIPDHKHARILIQKLRTQLDLYLQHRPIHLLNSDLTPIKNILPEKIRFELFIDVTSGFQSNLGGVQQQGNLGTIGLQEYLVSQESVERFIESVFQYASDHDLPRITLAEKSNLLKHTHGLWVRIFESIKKRFENIEARHLSVDALIPLLFRDPSEFQIIATPQLFGDILSEIGAILQGGLGMAANGYINPQKIGVFKPIHGAAPTFAGKNVANPLGAVLCLQMIMEFINQPKLGKLITDGVRTCIDHNWTTHDIGGSLGTEDVGDYICQTIEALYKNP